jgi:hypothetical protein
MSYPTVELLILFTFRAVAFAGFAGLQGIRVWGRSMCRSIGPSPGALLSGQAFAALATEFVYRIVYYW